MEVSMSGAEARRIRERIRKTMAKAKSKREAEAMVNAYLDGLVRGADERER